MRVFCVLSDERAFRSKSPGMFAPVLQRLRIDAMYVPFSIRAQDLPAAVVGLKALGIAGANVTVPFKESIMKWLDRIDTEASVIGAVNTIVVEDNQLVGHNTDAGGFVDSLQHAGFSAPGKRAIVFGTGGAARAVLYALGQIGLAGITVVGRTVGRAEDLARTHACEARGLDSMRGLTVSANLVVNATSVSSAVEAPDVASLVGSVKVDGCELVMDLNYHRNDNMWKRLADAADANFMDGLPLLAYQACRSFTLWTGLKVNPEYFIEALGGIS